MARYISYLPLSLQFGKQTLNALPAHSGSEMDILYLATVSLIGYSLLKNAVWTRLTSAWCSKPGCAYDQR